MNKPELFVCNCCFGDIKCARYKCITCIDYDLCSECAFQTDGDTTGTHDPFSHVLMRIYNSETSPVLTNENNDIIDQLALFDTLQIFKQDLDSMSKHMKVSTQAIRTNVKNVYDQFAADQMQSEMDCCPQLQYHVDEGCDESATTRSRSAQSANTSPESAIVTVWDSLQAIANYDDCDAARELLLYDKWMQKEEEMKAFNLSHLLRGKNLSEVFRRIPDAQKHLQRIPLVVSQSAKRSAQQKRKLLMDAVQVKSRSKTARYVDEILSEAVKEHFTTQTPSSSTTGEKRGNIHNARQYQNIDSDLHAEPAAVPGVALCASLHDVVSALHALVKWKVEDLRSEGERPAVDNSPSSFSQPESGDDAGVVVKAPWVTLDVASMPELDEVVISTIHHSLTVIGQDVSTFFAPAEEVSYASSNPYLGGAVKRVLVEQISDDSQPRSKKTKHEEVSTLSRGLATASRSFAALLTDPSSCTDLVLFEPSQKAVRLPWTPFNMISQRLMSDVHGVVVFLNNLLCEFNCMQRVMGQDLALGHLATLLSQWRLHSGFVTTAVKWLRCVTTRRKKAQTNTVSALLLADCAPQIVSQQQGVEAVALTATTLSEEPLDMHIMAEELDCALLQHHSQSATAECLEPQLEDGAVSGGPRETDLDSETFFQSSTNSNAQSPFTSNAEGEDAYVPTDLCEFRPIQPHALSVTRRGSFLALPAYLPPRRVAVIPHDEEKSTATELSHSTGVASSVVEVENNAAVSSNTSTSMESDLLFFDELFDAEEDDAEEAMVVGDLHCVSHETESTIDSLSPGEEARLSDGSSTESIGDKVSSALRVAQTAVRSILKKRPYSVSRITVHLSPSARQSAANAKKKVRFMPSQSQNPEDFSPTNVVAVAETIVSDEDEEDDALANSPLRSKHCKVDLLASGSSSKESDKTLRGELVYDFFTSKQDGCIIAEDEESGVHRTSCVMSFTTPLFGSSPVSPPSTNSTCSDNSNGGASGDVAGSTPSEGDWMFGNWGSFDFDEEDRVTHSQQQPSIWQTRKEKKGCLK